MRKGEVGGGGVVHYTLVAWYNVWSKLLFGCMFSFSANMGGIIISYDSEAVNH